MNATRWLSLSLAGVIAGVFAAEADARHPSGGHYEYARVVAIEPLVRRVRVERPIRQCWDETEYRAVHRGHDRRGTAGSTLVGGLVGAAVGRQFGGGSGRNAATLAGGLVGAAVASERAHERELRRGHGSAHTTYQPVTVERCSVHTEYHEEERVDGYDVTYRYGGRTYQTRTSSPPGDRIRVRVDVKPAHY